MDKKHKIAVYPGTFDPLTFGHLDIISRASNIFDRLIVAVAGNKHKNPVFSIEERVSFLKNGLSNLENVVIDSFDELLVGYLKKVKADVIIRGLRVVTDFDYEFAFAAMNRKMAPEIDTVFLMTSEKYSFISSSLVKEVLRYNGDVSGYVPESVIKELKNRI